MEQVQTQEQRNLLFQDEKSGFDITEWLLKIGRFWYLFVFALLIALGLAMLQNRKWIPSYLSSGTMLIKEYTGSGYGSQALLQGVGVDAGYKNVNNQVIMLSSYDLLSRVVDSLPFLQTEYITQGRFKTRNIYKKTPIVVEPTAVSDFAYNWLFEIEIQDNTLHITSTQEDYPLNLTAHYGEPVETPYFNATFWPTEYMVKKGKMFFRFRDKGSLVGEFMGRLNLSFVTEGSTVLSISLVSETPERDCDFINKLSELYLEDNLNRKNEVADNSIRFINQQIELLQEQLIVSESAMTNFRRENKFVDVSAYAGTLMQKMENYDAEEMALRLKETYLNYLTQYLQSSMAEGNVIAPSSLGLNEPMLMSLVQQLNDLQIQRGELSEKNIYYAKYTKDIANVCAAIRETIHSMRASLEIEKNDLKARSGLVEKDIQHLPEKELEMVAIERNYRINDNYYTFFLQKRAETEIQKASNTPDNAVLDKARTTYITNASVRKKTLWLYLLVGLLVPLVIVILMELLNNKVRTPKEVEKLSKFPLIGSVRHTHTQNPTLVAQNPRSSYAEMLRTVRTKIEFILQRKDKITITITSSQSGDGKTFLATNLAALYAMTGRKTLLVDLDIRKPNVHDKLGLDNGMGITNYLVEECSLDDILLTDTPYQFDIVRAGTIPPNPGELIRSDHLTQFLNQMRERYDFIILDSSPIGQVPDADALIGQTDMTLYVIRCNKTNRFFCKNTLQQLSLTYQDKIQLLLSDTPHERKHYMSKEYYKYTYNYGYGYGNYGGKNDYNYYSDDE